MGPEQFLFVAPEVYDEKTVKKRWKEDSAQLLTELAGILESIDNFDDVEATESTVKEWIAGKGYHLGNIMNAFRLALVGESKGPQMFDLTAVLGKEETLRRLYKAIKVLG